MFHDYNFTIFKIREKNMTEYTLKELINNKIIVIKYGGNSMTDEKTKSAMIEKIAALKSAGAHVVVVHGGGPQINQMLDTLNVEHKFVDGYRYSCKKTVATVDMILGGTVNQDIVAGLNAYGCCAVGLTGKDAGQFTITPKKTSNGESLGYVADITNVDTTLMTVLLNNNYTVVIAPPSMHNKDCYNLNADTVAGAVAGALKSRLFHGINKCIRYYGRK